MPKKSARSRRSVATLVSTAVIGASVAVLLVSPVATPTAAAVAAPGSTQRVSVANKDNQSPEGGNESVISTDGNHVAFQSSSQLDNLDTHQDGQALINVYVRDLRTGRTVMISRGTPPPPPEEPGFGANKRLDLGAPAKQAMAQQAAEVPPDGMSYSPSLSADGRYVAFVTYAGNIRGAEGHYQKIVVCDRDPDGSGVFDEDRDGRRDYRCFPVSNRTSDSVSEPKLSADAGRIVWLNSHYGNAFNRLRTAVLRAENGDIGAPQTVDEVPADLGDKDFALDQQFDPTISGDGNHIVMHATYYRTCECDYSIDRSITESFFESFHAIISTDMRTGAVTRVDIDDGENEGQPNPISDEYAEFVMHPATSFDGTAIAFVAERFRSTEGGWVSEADHPDVFVVRVDYTAAPPRVTRTDIVSRDNNFELVNGERPALSGDGRYVAFVTDALRTHDGADGPPDPGGHSCIKPPPVIIRLTDRPMLQLSSDQPAPRDVRTKCQVVVRDLIVDLDRRISEIDRLDGTLVSPNEEGNAGNDDTVPDRGFSTAPSLSSDGGRVAYDSRATDLVSGDNNKRIDAFVRTMEPELRAETVNFGSVELGQSDTQSAELSVFGNGPLVVEKIEIIGPNTGDFRIGDQTCQGEGLVLYQTGRCTVEVTFEPAAAGDRRGILRITVRGERVFTVGLAGSGTERPVPPSGPRFAAGPDPVNFGSHLLLSSTESAVTITNEGDLPLRVSAVTIVGPGAPGDYSVGSNSCVGSEVPPGGLCRVSVKFSPKLPGERNAVLQFNDNARGGPHLIGLRGQSGQPVIEVSPAVTPPGRVVTVTGKEFPPGKAVTVKFDGRSGQSTAVAGADGTFRVGLLIFPKSSPETRTILATVDGFAEPLARSPLLIVFPTVSPAEFVVRG